MSQSKKVFASYIDTPTILPPWIWWLPRLLILAFSVYLVFLLITQPALGLTIFWKLTIPILPAVFAFAPGLYRTLCPMAFLNQLPRHLKFTKGFTLSAQGRKIAFLCSLMGFFGFISLRHPLFNHSGTAVAILALCALLGAFIGGVLFKGRSGWCGTFCPLAPIQKLYGHAPLVMIKNSYCEPCLGCQNNCYDFNPNAAVFSDVYDNDPWWADKRRFFAAALPGLIIGFFNASMPAEHGIYTYYISVFLPVFISIGLFQTLYNFTRLTDYKVVGLFSMGALMLFYWYALPLISSGLKEVFNLQLPDIAITIARTILAALGLLVIGKGFWHERLYLKTESSKVTASVGKGITNLQQAAQNIEQQEGTLIEQASGKSFSIEQGKTLLDTIESADLPIMAGCRMGNCGADPIVITDGHENLAPPSDDELVTLRRLGLEGKARLACCCKASGEVTIDLSIKPEEAEISAPVEEKLEEEDPNRLKVIVVGNGIAGISCAETLRSKDPKCEINILSEESFYSYNRIALEKIIHGRSGMDGLYLFKDDWYKQQRLKIWLNTQAAKIIPKDKTVELGTGEILDYDKLVLATGARAFEPPVMGSDLPGCFVLRKAEDALNLRTWIQTHQCKNAVILGGGILGVEAADALRMTGLTTMIIELSDRLMGRQLDQVSAGILSHYLAGLGIYSRVNSGVQTLMGDQRIHKIMLKSGEVINTDIFLICAGIRSNTDLALAAGIEVNRGIVVNDQMQTSIPDIYAVGDAAELAHSLGGLWAVGNEQGRVAAANIAGEESHYQPLLPPPVQLKMEGIDLRSFGQIEAQADEILITNENKQKHLWLSIVVKAGLIIGGVFVNAPTQANSAMLAAKKNKDITAFIDKIKKGDWSDL